MPKPAKYKYPHKRPAGKKIHKIFINANDAEKALFVEAAKKFRKSLSQLGADSIIEKVKREAPDLLKKHPEVDYI